MTDSRIRLGVNIDHVATVRQARGEQYPEPIQAAFEAQLGGADGITMHLREDRRHIQERDVRLCAELVELPLNLEMAVTEEILRFAEELRPENACLVPEKREELTTEGGLNVVRHKDKVSEACARLSDAGCLASLFIDPDPEQVECSARVGAKVIEIHTGRFANARSAGERQKEYQKILSAAELAYQSGLQVNAGHGLHYQNVEQVAAISCLTELNIGHAIIAQALLCGLRSAVSEMKRLMIRARAL